MKYLTIIGVVASSLAFVAPEMAANGRENHAHDAYRAYRGTAMYRRMPAQDYDHFDYGTRRPTFHSGWGGPYGDGDYPGTVDQNMGPPYWAY
jgi:hypothetical protein